MFTHSDATQQRKELTLYLSNLRLRTLKHLELVWNASGSSKSWTAATAATTPLAPGAAAATAGRGNGSSRFDVYLKHAERLVERAGVIVVREGVLLEEVLTDQTRDLEHHLRGDNKKTDKKQDKKNGLEEATRYTTQHESKRNIPRRIPSSEKLFNTKRNTNPYY